MEKFFNGIFKFSAALCALLFVLSVGVAMALFNAEKRLFDAQLYAQALESQNFYERLPALAAETLAAAPQEEEGDLNAVHSLLAVVPAENWEAAMRALLPAEVSKPMTEQAIASVFDYLNGQSETAALSLTGFKAHVNGPASAQAFVEILRAQPPCTLEQMAEMTFGALAGKPKLLFCNPPDEALGLMQPLIQTGLQTAAAGIPETITLIRPNAGGAQTPLDDLRALRALMRFSPLVPLGLLLLITILAVRDLKDWLNWWGLPLLLGGLFGLLIAASVVPLFQWGFAAFAAPRLPTSLPDSVTEILRGLVASVLSGLAAPIFFQSAALALIGIVMLFATRALKTNRSRS